MSKPFDHNLVDDFVNAMQRPQVDRAAAIKIFADHPNEAYAALDRLARSISMLRMEISAAHAKALAEAEKAKP